jgi:hypothetical protein
MINQAGQAPLNNAIGQAPQQNANVGNAPPQLGGAHAVQVPNPLLALANQGGNQQPVLRVLNAATPNAGAFLPLPPGGANGRSAGQ